LSYSWLSRAWVWLSCAVLFSTVWTLLSLRWAWAYFRIWQWTSSVNWSSWFRFDEPSWPTGSGSSSPSIVPNTP
jgi:hypothetical protein